MANPITIRELGPEDAHILDRARPGTFDNPVNPALAYAFLVTGVNEMVVALCAGEVVGFASGTALMHPDKPTAFFVNELSVHDDFRRQGIGRRLMHRIVEVARDRGCEGIWLATEQDNTAARQLYAGMTDDVSEAVVYAWDDAL
ncbi:MAG: GNAT family N-acetyltransferase [Pseudomonadota bacterium]